MVLPCSIHVNMESWQQRNTNYFIRDKLVFILNKIVGWNLSTESQRVNDIQNSSFIIKSIVPLNWYKCLDLDEGQNNFETTHFSKQYFIPLTLGRN